MWVGGRRRQTNNADPFVIDRRGREAGPMLSRRSRRSLSDSFLVAPCHDTSMFRKRPTATGPFPSGVKPDAITEDKIVLIKACARLRLTRQIRLATAMAKEQNKTLLLIVRNDCDLTQDLKLFLDGQQGLVETKRG